MARRAKSGSSRGGPSRSGMRARLAVQEVAERGDDEPVRLGVPDRQAQRMRQAVGLDPPQHQPARGEEGVRVLRGPPRRLRENARGGSCRRSASPGGRDPRSRASARAATRRCGPWRAATCASSPSAATPGRDGEAVDVERAADAVHGVDHMRRADHPAEPEIGEAVDLGERPRHDDVLGSSPRARGRTRNRCAARIRRRPRRARAGRCRAGRHAGA